MTDFGFHCPPMPSGYGEDGDNLTQPKTLNCDNHGCDPVYTSSNDVVTNFFAWI